MHCVSAEQSDRPLPHLREEPCKAQNSVKTVPGLEQTNGVTAKAVLPQIDGADHNGGTVFIYPAVPLLFFAASTKFFLSDILTSLSLG